ncbi:MAG TPA: hypothetical protein PKA05_22705, partial [Roseiflexaceae bacterium]|nr:hypothetical protein [Roseiflexaceae bacterium]
FFAVAQPRAHTTGAPSRPLAGLLAGLAFGQWALARIDFFLIMVPLAAYLAYLLLTRRIDRPHLLMVAGATAMLLHAALHAILIARAYLFDTLFARLQDYALTALLAMPFLTPTLRT